jgi:heat shock protein 4
MQNNKIAFEVVQGGNTHTLTIEQVIAFYLQKLHDFYVKDEVTTKDIVVTIPSYASNTERQSLVDAAEIAGLKCLRVINESTAIAYNYGFFRKGDLSKDEERIVAFIDMGHSKTTITIAGFKCQEARIIVHKSDRNLGGRDCDYQIMQKLGEEFLAKFGEDPRESPRCRLRLFEVIEKARKLLSGDTEASINIDYLMNEEDLNRKLSRDEFETLIDPQIRQFTALLRATIEASGKLKY